MDENSRKGLEEALQIRQAAELHLFTMEYLNFAAAKDLFIKPKALLALIEQKRGELELQYSKLREVAGLKEATPDGTKRPE